MKEFRDLIHIYQKKNHQDESIIPMTDFKTVLKSLGITLTNQVSNKLQYHLTLITLIDFVKVSS